MSIVINTTQYDTLPREVEQYIAFLRGEMDKYAKSAHTILSDVEMKVITALRAGERVITTEAGAVITSIATEVKTEEVKVSTVLSAEEQRVVTAMRSGMKVIETESGVLRSVSGEVVTLTEDDLKKLGKVVEEGVTDLGADVRAAVKDAVADTSVWFIEAIKAVHKNEKEAVAFIERLFTHPKAPAAPVHIAAAVAATVPEVAEVAVPPVTPEPETPPTTEPETPPAEGSEPTA
jgi:hypothetical protein